jgi:GNAT superfamily N-acetyltransferase
VAELLIRAATDADRETCIALIQALNVAENAIIGDRREDLPAAQAHYAILRAKLAEADGEILLAQRAGTVVALAAWLPEDDEVYVIEPLRRVAVVAELIVIPEARGQGIARALLAAIEARARALGIRRLLVGFVEGNEAAAATYAAFGFRPYARRVAKSLD